MDISSSSIVVYGVVAIVSKVLLLKEAARGKVATEERLKEKEKERG